MELNLLPDLTEAQVQLLLDVLGWYADPMIYEPRQNPILTAMYRQPPAVLGDGGRRAREALEAMS